MPKKIVIVGTGLVGLAAGKILEKKNYSITYIDKSQRLGGFLQSVKNKNNTFDFGTHFLKKTGIKKLDNILFRQIEKKWIKLKFLKSGCYFNGLLFNKNQFININAIQNSKKIFNQIITIKKNRAKPKNDLEKCYSTFGKILTDKYIQPIIYKYTGKKLINLPPNFCSKFALGRITFSDNKIIKKLKKKKFFDGFIAFKNYTEGVSKNYSFYPKSNGIGDFVNFFKNNKCKYILGNEIKKINIKNNAISSIILDNQLKIDCDYLIWSSPPIFLYKILGLQYDTKVKKIFWNFINLVSNKKFNTDCHYINIHDPKTNLYRITFYNNIQNSNFFNSRCTLEIVNSFNKKINFQIIEKYLKKTKIIDQSHKLNFLNEFTIPINLPNKRSQNKKIKIKNLLNFSSNLFEQKNQEQNLINMYNLLIKNNLF